MNYTDLASFKLALGTEVTSSDDELEATIEAVSRALDRKLTGAVDSDNYLELETVIDEEIMGQIDSRGRVICYPHKPRISSVSSFEYRHTPFDVWRPVSKVSVDQSRVTAWCSDPNREKVFVKISYQGGLFEEDSIAGDLKDAVTVLAVRFYREIKSGLGDSIAVAELGTLVYTKAWPIRVLDMIQPYKRIVPWT